jgi:LysM repeat protein
MKTSHDKALRVYTRKLVVLAGLSILALMLWAISPPILQAQSGCSNPYTIQRGDYLHAIARRFNTSVGVLISLNPWLAYNPNLILPGQVVCLPAQGPGINTLNIVAEITFTYEPDILNPLTVGPLPTPATADRKLNKRVVYSLELGKESDVALGSGPMKNKLEVTPGPVLVAVDTRQPQPDPNHPSGSYYLVAIGAQNASLLQRLGFLDDPITVKTDAAGDCNPTPLKEAFGTGVKDAEGTIAVEGANGYRHVFGLSDLHIVQNWVHFKQCYDTKRTLFALFPPIGGQPDKFHLFLLTTDPENPGGGEGYYNQAYYQPSPRWWWWGFRFWW